MIFGGTAYIRVILKAISVIAVTLLPNVPPLPTTNPPDRALVDFIVGKIEQMELSYN